MGDEDCLERASIERGKNDRDDAEHQFTWKLISKSLNLFFFRTAHKFLMNYGRRGLRWMQVTIMRVGEGKGHLDSWWGVKQVFWPQWNLFCVDLILLTLHNRLCTM